MSIEKGDATKYVHTGNGELCYELNKALTVPETFPIYLSSAYIFDSIDPIDKICDEGAPGYAYFRLGNPNADATSQILAAGDGAEKGLVFSSGMAAITDLHSGNGEARRSHRGLPHHLRRGVLLPEV